MTAKRKRDVTTRPPEGRRGVDSSFGAARARRVLAADIPDVVYSKPSGRPRLSPLSPSPVSRAAPPPLAGAVNAHSKLSLQPPASLVRDIDSGSVCKARPASNKSKGGGSRSFVPWCSARK